MKADLLAHLRRRWSAIAEDGSWMWLVNAKVANTSIRKVLDPTSRHPWHYRNAVRPFDWRDCWDALLPQIDTAVKFTFVRNPWDRVVSAWHFLRQNNGQLARRFRGRVGNEVTFERFVKEYLDGPPGVEVDRHFAKQSPTFLFKGEPIPGVLVGRYESLATDWRRIAGILGVDRTLPKIHHHKSEHGHYAEYYDAEGVDIVRRTYQEEIEALGYEFGN